jgi:hypothetical protein
LKKSPSVDSVPVQIVANEFGHCFLCFGWPRRQSACHARTSRCKTCREAAYSPEVGGFLIGNKIGRAAVLLLNSRRTADRVKVPSNKAKSERFEEVVK